MVGILDLDDDDDDDDIDGEIIEDGLGNVRLAISKLGLRIGGLATKLAVEIRSLGRLVFLLAVDATGIIELIGLSRNLLLTTFS